MTKRKGTEIIGAEACSDYVPEFFYQCRLVIIKRIRCCSEQCGLRNVNTIQLEKRWISIII